MKLKTKRRILSAKKFTWDFILIIFGSLILAFGISFLLLPNKLSSGGFSGIATITYYLFNLPVGIVMLVLNIPLFILSYIRIGKNFLIRGIIGTISLSIFIDIFDKLEPITHDSFLSCIYGGVAVGLGTAIILKTNASTRRNRPFKLYYKVIQTNV